MQNTMVVWGGDLGENEMGKKEKNYIKKTEKRALQIYLGYKL